jgi:hypothetical protein
MFEDWLGEDVWIQKLATFYPVMDYVGDTLTTRGSITARMNQNGRKCLDCDVWIENQRGEVGTVGTARIVLPEHVEI